MEGLDGGEFSNMHATRGGHSGTTIAPKPAARSTRAFSPIEPPMTIPASSRRSARASRAARHERSARTLVVDSYAAAAELVTGLLGDGVHFTCTALPAGGWTFSVPATETETLDALLMLANRAATRSPAMAMAMVSR